MSENIEVTGQTEALRGVDQILNVKRSRVTKYVKNFIEKMKYHFPETDLTMNEQFEFINEETRKAFAVYTLGWSARDRVEMGAFVLATVVNGNLQFAKSPKVMETMSTALVARRYMNRKHKQPFYIFGTSRAEYDLMRKQVGLKSLKHKDDDTGSAEDAAIKVTVS